MIRALLDRFWDWYERHYVLNVGIAATLFVLQLVHLYWLTTDVVTARLFGLDLFQSSAFWEMLIVLVDYTEIPAIITTSLVYVHELRDAFNWKSLFYLVFVDIQLVHIFWITDAFILQQFDAGHAAIMPLWVAWIAIFIDYLELPVIYETVQKFLVALRARDFAALPDAPDPVETTE